MPIIHYPGMELLARVEFGTRTLYGKRLIFLVIQNHANSGIVGQKAHKLLTQGSIHRLSWPF